MSSSGRNSELHQKHVGEEFVHHLHEVKGRLNRFPSACVGDLVIATLKKVKPDLLKMVMPAGIVRRRKPWSRKDGVSSCTLKIPISFIS